MLTLASGSSSLAALQKQRTDNDAQSAVVLPRVVHRVIVRADEQHRRIRIWTCSKQISVIQRSVGIDYRGHNHAHETARTVYTAVYVPNCVLPREHASFPHPAPDLRHTEHCVSAEPQSLGCHFATSSGVLGA